MKTESGLYDALKVILQEANEPLTCVRIWEDHQAVREYAKTANRVSDYLGGLWRKGLLLRLPAPRTDSDSSRWAYQWRKDLREPDPIAFPTAIVLKKPGITISEDGNKIVLDLPHLTITIQTKN